MFNSKGMTLVQTVVGMGIAAVTVVGIAGIFAQTMGVSKDVDIQALIDTRHMDVIHRAGSLQFLRKNFSLNAGTSPKAESLENCLRGRGSGCRWHEGEKTLVDPEGDFNSSYSLKLGKCSKGPTCVVHQQARYQWVCLSEHACTGLKLNVQTSYTGPETKKKYHTRVFEMEIPGRSLVSRADIAFDCTNVGMIMSIDYKELRANCVPISGPTMADQYLPAQTIGPEVTRNPGEERCGAGGLSSIGLFASQSNCQGLQDASREPASSSAWVTGMVPEPPAVPRTKKTGSAFVVSARGVTFGANGEHIANLNYDYKTGQFQCSSIMTSFDRYASSSKPEAIPGNFASEYAGCSASGSSATLWGSCDSLSGGTHDFCIGRSYKVTAAPSTADGCGISIRIKTDSAEPRNLSIYSCEPQ